TEFTKQIVLAVTDDKIYSYIVFAASILYGESEPMIDNNSLRELLERQITRFESTSKDDLPSHFKNHRLKEDEHNQILNGWHSRYADVLHIIGVSGEKFDTDSFIRGHRIVCSKELDRCIASGLFEVIKGVSKLPAGTGIGVKA
ncbi:MAG TPA: hypothetical protein VFG19_16150, partial [Geobacteraceae bacterium]|nr:hypothetical protein [Geobacteraceae bacterium]